MTYEIGNIHDIPEDAINDNNVQTLEDALREDYDLLDLCVLGGRVDSDIAEYANEFGVTKSEVKRIINKLIMEGN